MQSFAATWQTNGDLRLEGELDLAAEEQAVAALRSRPAAANDLVIDLSRLTFMDSTGIRVLETVAMGPGAVAVTLRSPQRAVRRVLDLVGIARWPNVAVRDESRPATRHEDPFIF
jgi:anti-anti-sigma factor